VKWSALLLLAAVAPDGVAQGACGAVRGSAVPFGPEIPAADTGRIYSSLLSPDGQEFYFFRKVGEPRSEDYRIYRSTRQGNSWSAPMQVALGGDFSDLYPSLSADGRRMVFSSYRPVPGDTFKHPNAHLWMTVRDGNRWGAPTLLPASRIGYYHSGLRQDAAGNLTFGRNTPDWSGAESLRLRWLGDRYAAEPEPVANPATEYWRKTLGDTVHVWHTITVPGGVVLVQVSQLSGANRRRGPSVNFVSRQTATGWTPLVRAGGGLGEGAPNFLWFSDDGCWVHYTRDYSSFWRAPMSTVVAGLR
jgi:hypothetical protein